MTILSAQSIGHLCQWKDSLEEYRPLKGPLITPFHERTTFQGFTFGLGPCGYDIRIAQDLVMYQGNFKLASSIERFCLPDFLCMKILDKSTWARMGLFVQNTVAEPGWEGYLTLELTYQGTAHTVQIVKGTPIAQVQFELLDQPTSQPYKGKYQNQAEGAQLPILEE